MLGDRHLDTVAWGCAHKGALEPPSLEGNLGRQLGVAQPVVHLGVQGRRPEEARLGVLGRRPGEARLAPGALELVP